MLTQTRLRSRSHSLSETGSGSSSSCSRRMSGCPPQLHPCIAACGSHSHQCMCASITFFCASRKKRFGLCICEMGILNDFSLALSMTLLFPAYNHHSPSHCLDLQEQSTTRDPTVQYTQYFNTKVQFLQHCQSQTLPRRIHTPNRGHPARVRKHN